MNTHRLPIAHRINTCKAQILRARALILLLNFTLFAGLQIQAQDKLNHKLRVDKTLVACDGLGTPVVPAKTRTIRAGMKFSISAVKDDDYVIRFWKWTEEIEAFGGAESAAFDKTATSAEVQVRQLSMNSQFRTDYTTGVEIYFLLPKSDLGTYTTEMIANFSPVIGASVLPFKLRPQDGEFTKDLTLAGMGGVKYNPFRSKGFSLAALLGLGLTSVSLDSLNTDGKVTSSSDRSAITVSTGLVIQWEKLQLGLFMGWDHLNKSDRDLWVYQGDHWLGLGIGITIFSENKGASESGNK